MTDENYRPLGPDEVIHPSLGDENQRVGNPFWYTTLPVVEGRKVSDFPDFAFRRPIKSNLSEPPNSSERAERCTWCGNDVTDWVDPDWSNGRICRPCEAKLEPTTNLQQTIKVLGDEPSELDRLRTRVAELEERSRIAESALEKHGYRRECNIPACNCPPHWNHGGHAAERLHEIADEVWENGKTALQSVKDLRTRAETAETAEKERDEARARVKGLEDATRHLISVIEAHETESLQCDGRAEPWCDCLSRATTKARQALETKGE